MSTTSFLSPSTRVRLLLLASLLICLQGSPYPLSAQAPAGKKTTAKSNDSTADQRPLLKTLYRHEHRYEEFLAGKKTQALVCIFMSTTCPIAQQYLPRLTQIYHEVNGRDGQTQSLDPYQDKVKFLAVYSNSSDDVFGMAKHHQDRNYPFPPVLDIKGRFASFLKITRTPEVVVLDRKRTIRYRGAIDDQVFKGGLKPKARQHYLRDALKELIGGKAVSRPETVAVGCLLERHSRVAKKSSKTFYKDILPIMQRHCRTCHRPGAVGPFSLIDYRDVVNHASMIAEVVHDRRMPPWPGASQHAFINDRRLNQDQIDTIRSWVKGGLPAGKKSDAPKPLTFRAKSWQIGKPEVIFAMEKPFTVPATGIVDYQYHRFKLNAKKDKWIKAVEIQPGNEAIVHHILAYQVKAGQGKLGPLGMLQLYGGLSASQSDTMVADFSPGDENSARRYNLNQGLRLRAGTDIIVELHYTPIGKVQTDLSKIGFVFSDKPPKREIKSRLFLKTRGRFFVPKRHPHFRMQDEYWFEEDVRLIGIRPHMHLRAKNYRLEIVYPKQKDKKPKTILQLPIWDYNWHKTYMFKKPIELKAGQELRATVYYDNSDLNPGNPDPDQEVRWGQGTLNEMFNTFVLYERVSK